MDLEQTIARYHTVTKLAKGIHVGVLLVEDEPSIREIMADCLQDAGYEVMQAENGDRAVELIRQPALRFTVVVTDFHMPGETDGAEVAACAREALPDIAVVIVSGRPDVLQHQWQQDCGYRLLKKP